jgi:hypothetical protein
MFFVITGARRRAAVSLRGCCRVFTSNLSLLVILLGGVSDRMLALTARWRLPTGRRQFHDLSAQPHGDVRGGSPFR